METVKPIMTRFLWGKQTKLYMYITRYLVDPAKTVAISYYKIYDLCFLIDFLWNMDMVEVVSFENTTIHIQFSSHSDFQATYSVTSITPFCSIMNKSSQHFSFY